MELDHVDTFSDLKLWLSENMPTATLAEGEGGITISTGLESAMGGYLSPIEREGDSDDIETVSWSSSNPTGEIVGECAYCESGVAEIHNHEREGE